MRLRLTTIVAVIVVFVTMAPVMTPSAVAQDVTTWVEPATTTPGVGCVVDVSVEVRSGGSPISGADITVALSVDDTGDVLSLDRGVTNDSGVAWLVFDTGAGWSGAKSWLEVIVNGSYVGGKTIWIGDSSCSGNSSSGEMDGVVATISEVASSGSPSSGSGDSGGAVKIANVWNYAQQRTLSCEYAALSIATGALGGWIDEYQFDDVVPLSDNPHWGYRGDITGIWGNTDDYGVYAAPLVSALAQFGYTGHAFYGGGSNDELIASIDAGRPTLVWIGLGGDTSFDDYASDGSRFQLTPYMHVMVAYGYDDSGVYLSDPGTGSYKYYDWGTFMYMWDIMDGMALGVSN